MATSENCLNEIELRQFLLGEIAEDAALRFERHLTTCSVCSRLLKQVPADDDLVQNIRTVAYDSMAPDSEEISALVHRIAHSRPVTNASTQTDHDTLDKIREFLAPPQESDEIGRLDSFRIIAALGEGGMGIVLRGEDEKLSRPVAVKWLKPELAQKPGMRERFLREARAMAAVQHESVIPIFQVGEIKGVPYFIMPLLDGETLASRLRRQERLHWQQVTALGRQLASGLAAAHQRDLIHRDVNPNNIWIETDENVKLLDFGLACEVEQKDRLTQTGHILGTPGYIAPEQADGALLDGRCDQFGLGCVLYEMCTGRSPFRRVTLMASLSAVANHHPTPPHRLAPDVPAALSQTIMQLLAKDPKQRFASCLEVKTALEQCRNGGRARLARLPKRWVFAVCAVVLLAAIAAIAIEILPTWWIAPSDSDSKVPKSPPTVSPKKIDDGLLHRTPIRRFEGHTAPVLCVAFSPEGRYVASGSADQTIRLWDVDTGKTVHTFTHHKGEVRALSFSPTGAYLASAGADRIAWMWDVIDKKPIWNGARHSDEYHDIAFSPSGGYLIAASRDKQIPVWRSKNGDAAYKLNWHKNAVRCAAFTPIGLHAVSGGEDGLVVLWDVRDQRAKFQFKGHTRPVADIQVSRFGRFAVTGSWDKTVRLWDLKNGKEYHKMEGHKGSVFAVALTADNVWILSGGAEHAVRLWNASTGKLHGYLEGHRDHVLAIDTSRDLRYAITAGADNTLLLWRLPAGKSDLVDP